MFPKREKSSFTQLSKETSLSPLLSKLRSFLRIYTGVDDAKFAEE